MDNNIEKFLETINSSIMTGGNDDESEYDTQSELTETVDESVTYDSDEETIQIDAKELQDFKSLVKSWITYDDEIRTLQQSVKDRKKQRDTLAPVILEFMNSHRIDDLNTQDGGKLEYKVTKHKKPINKQTLRSKLAEYFRNMTKSEEAVKYVYDNRDTTEKISLRRKVKKADKNKLKI